VKRWLWFAYLALGVVLLLVVARETDLAAVWDQALHIGLAGVAAVLLVYLLSFVSDAMGWHLALDSAPLTPAWLGRLFLVRMVGEAFNAVTPAASLGGEPVKAVLLKRYHGFGYRESGASLVLARTVNVLMLVPFLAVGFVLLVGDARVPLALKSVAGAGLAALGSGILLFYLVQRFRVSTLAGRRLSRFRAGRRLVGVLHHIAEFDDRLVRFYTARHARFAGALVLGFANWVLGVVEVWAAMHFLGHPVSFADAWIIESVAQLVRAGLFFIPGAIGAQEGAFVLIAGALTGDGVLGFALALVRRFRELVWIATGLVLAWLYSLRAPHAAPGAEPARR